jgi:hypothetical protein
MIFQRKALDAMATIPKKKESITHSKCACLISFHIQTKFTSLKTKYRRTIPMARKK